MLTSALLAYIHYLTVFGVVASLVTELFVFAPELSTRSRRILQQADTIYGISAIGVLITGFARVFYLGKGSEYYFSNSIFLTKLGLFIIIGVLSIYPTVIFLKWKKLEEEVLVLETSKYLSIRRVILLEVLLIFVMPLLAAMMARGIGV